MIRSYLDSLFDTNIEMRENKAYVQQLIKKADDGVKIYNLEKIKIRNATVFKNPTIKI